MIVRCQPDLVNTKENVLPVCDQPLSHEQKRQNRKGMRLKFCGTVHYSNKHPSSCFVLNHCLVGLVGT